VKALSPGSQAPFRFRKCTVHTCRILAHFCSRTESFDKVAHVCEAIEDVDLILDYSDGPSGRGPAMGSLQAIPRILGKGLPKSVSDD
jgi:hypothetical protein